MPLSSTENNSYQLNLEQQKRNVFVTQLNEQQAEDDDIRRFPIVKETADKLLHTGINTLQKTSLLRKAVEVEEIDKELAEKREEFRKRMAENKAKEEALKKRQEKIKDRVTKFDRFLKENDAKRTRAMRKYQLEVKENKVRAKELLEVKSELDTTKDNKAALLKKLESYKKYEEYMMKVIDILPENYLEMTGENMIQSVIQRYEGLAATHANLLQRNTTMAKDIEQGQRELEELKQEREKQKLMINSEMSELQTYQETLTQRVQRLEQEAGDTTLSHRTLIGELGRITMAIDNLAETCHTRHWLPLSEMSHIDKLNMINQHFTEQLKVMRMLQRLSETRQSVQSGGLPVVKASTRRPSKDTEGMKSAQHNQVTSEATKRKAKPATKSFIEQLKPISESSTE
uniref:Coiled-coil domain-containing protein 42 homolog n=1 Tax=Phallusia mammillata TaxID=59560 RepID=A0A6F9D9D9_9ASCI|nr:coiled-coil domain-containing protein 42 homolog [Phallusia mammillata]